MDKLEDPRRLLAYWRARLAGKKPMPVTAADWDALVAKWATS